jgi:hypothetical protein
MKKHIDINLKQRIISSCPLNFNLEEVQSRCFLAIPLSQTAQGVANWQTVSVELIDTLSGWSACCSLLGNHKVRIDGPVLTQVQAALHKLVGAIPDHEAIL